MIRALAVHEAERFEHAHVEVFALPLFVDPFAIVTGERLPRACGNRSDRVALRQRLTACGFRRRRSRQQPAARIELRGRERRRVRSELLLHAREEHAVAEAIELDETRGVGAELFGGDSWREPLPRCVISGCDPVRGRCGEHADPAEFARVCFVRRVLARVMRPVRIVAEHRRRDAEREEHVVIAALEIRDDVGRPPVARAGRREQIRVARLLDHVRQQRIEKRRHRHRRARHIEAAVRLHRVFADHVHVEVREHAAGVRRRVVAAANFRMLRQICGGAEVLRYPDEMNRLPRRRELARRDERLQRAHDLDHRRGAARVVVRTPLRMIEMSGDDDFLLGIFRPFDARVHERQSTLAECRGDVSAHAHRTLRHQRSESGVLICGDLKRAARARHVLGARPQSVVANHVGMIGTIVRSGINHRADGAVLQHRVIDDVLRVAVRERDLSLQVLPFVIGVARAGADVDELAAPVAAARI